MGAFKYIKANFENSFKVRSNEYRMRLQKWRGESAVTRVENPINPARARELGYKATRDFIVVRVRVKRGKIARPRASLGRKPAKNRIRENPGKPWLWIAEQKAKRFYPNMTALNSYWVGEDGVAQYYEVILKNQLDSMPQGIPKKGKVKVQALKKMHAKTFEKNEEKSAKAAPVKVPAKTAVKA